MAITRLIPVVAFVVLAPSYAQIPPKDNYVLTESDAYILMPPEFVAAPVVKRIEWSKDGRYLLAVRESNDFTQETVRAIAAGIQPKGPPPGDVSLILWSMQTRKSTELWRVPKGEGGVDEIHWLSHSAVAFLKVWRNRPTPNKPHPERVDQLIRLNAALGQIKVISEFADNNFAQIRASPVGRFAVVRQNVRVTHRIPQPDGSVKEDARNEDFLHLVRENGTLGRQIPAPMRSARILLYWASNGNDLILQANDIPATIEYRKKIGDPKAMVYRWFVLEPRSSRLTQKHVAPDRWTEQEQIRPVTLRQGTVAAKEAETTSPVSLLWLESELKSEHPRALVAANLESAKLSPAVDGIAHVCQGAAMVTPILKMPRELFTKMVEDAQRMTAISNGKQVGLALNMYAQDYDEVFPTPESINEKIFPYTKNASVFDGFVYTFPGGSMKDIAKPAETELGYVNGPRGRAIIFADGHVMWRPD